MQLMMQYKYKYILMQYKYKYIIEDYEKIIIYTHSIGCDD